jgi:hypothetical protein
MPVKIDETGEIFLQNEDFYNIKMYDQYQYVLNRSMPLYEKAEKGSEEREILKKGTKFTATAIKKGKKSDEYSTELYVKIKTTTGEKGWVYFPLDWEDENPYLKEVPGWA